MKIITYILFFLMLLFITLGNLLKNQPLKIIGYVVFAVAAIIYFIIMAKEDKKKKR